MKRFYCTTCKKQKRVRQLPNTVTGVIEHTPIGQRLTGTCRFHDDIKPRAVLNSRVRHVAGLGSTRKMSASTQKSKSKK